MVTGNHMGRALAYYMEGEPSRRLLEIRSRAVDDHPVFDGDGFEGEFRKRCPRTRMEPRGAHHLEDGMLSLLVTSVPGGQTMRHAEDLFRELVEGSP